MKRIQLRIWSGLLTAALLGACMSASGPDPVPGSTLLPGEGRLIVGIPAFGPGFLEQAGILPSRGLTGVSPGSRAFVAVTAARLELFGAGSTLPVDILELDRRALRSELDGGSGTYVHAWNIAAGRDFTIKVTLYNEANGTDAARRATAGGSSAPFAVTEGRSTYILVPTLPLAPVPLVAGEPSAAFALAAFQGSWDEPSTIVPGGERWFSFTATSTATRLLARTEEGSEAIPSLFVFMADGVTPLVPLYASLGIEPGEGCLLQLSTVKGAEYFVGAVDLAFFTRKYTYPDAMADPEADRSFTVGFGEAAADAFEDDDSQAAAIPVAEGELLVRSIYPVGDSDWFSFVANQDEVYSIGTHSIDSTRTPTSLSLLDAAGAVLVGQDAKFSSDPFVAIASWTCPATGTYAIQAKGAGNAIGDYALRLTKRLPPAELNLTLTPAALDPHHRLLVGWDSVPGAERYQVWISFVETNEGVEYISDPQALFEAGRELLPAECEDGAGRAMYTSTAMLGAGDTISATISWKSGGIWSSRSLPGRGRTAPDTTITVGLQ